LGRQLLGQVGARLQALVGGALDRLSLEEGGDRLGELAGEGGEGRRLAEELADAGEALGPPMPRRPRLPLLVEGPEEAGERARARDEAEEAAGGSQRQQLAEDRRRVAVVEAALVALVVAIGGDLADEGDEAALGARGVLEGGDREAPLPRLG